VELRALKGIRPDELAGFLEGGYSSPSRYAVRKIEDAGRTVIEAERVGLATPYTKQWERGNAEEIARYMGFAGQDYSLGTYDQGRLVGLALCETHRWNRTVWIWELKVAESHRRRGIGRRLVDAVARRASADGLRAIGLETQSTNVPAIDFYRAVGFELEGIDLSFYTNTDSVDGEVAFFMRRKLT
jgi:ribosomal protein S18 acetylase RimI-like enzyme